VTQKTSNDIAAKQMPHGKLSLPLEHPGCEAA
jgi:hypothetical protein